MTPHNLILPEQKTKSSPCSCTQDGCTKTGHQYADISIPVELKPKTTVGEVEVKCCGEPSVVCEESKCSNVCKVVITQKISINIPIHYQITACTGESTIECQSCQ